MRGQLFNANVGTGAVRAPTKIWLWGSHMALTPTEISPIRNIRKIDISSGF